MQIAINEFNKQISSTKELNAIYKHLESNLTSAVDLTDLLRAQIVYSVSSLDKLIHELVRIGMIEIYYGRRTATNKFSAFGISLNTLVKIQETSLIHMPQVPEDTAIYWFEREIILKHKILSFQDPDKMSDALGLIWQEEHKWQKIHRNMFQQNNYLLLRTEKDMKIYLKNIISRRNQIVHEADINILTGQKDAIDEMEVQEIVDFLNQLGNSVFKCVNL